MPAHNKKELKQTKTEKSPTPPTQQANLALTLVWKHQCCSPVQAHEVRDILLTRCPIVKVQLIHMLDEHAKLRAPVANVVDALNL